MKRLVFAPAAQEDLMTIGLSIADDSPARAESFVAEFEAKARDLAQWPASHPARDDISPGLRVAVHGRYLLLYREVDGEVRIVRVVHGARDVPRMFQS